FPKEEDMATKKWLTVHRDSRVNAGRDWWFTREFGDNIYFLMGAFSGEHISSSLTTAIVYAACNLLLNEARIKGVNLEPKQISSMLNQILENSVKDTVQTNF